MKKHEDINNQIIKNTCIENLLVWADENKISNKDLPRDKEQLLSLKYLELGLDGCFLDNIPKEIGILTNLLSLSLSILSDKKVVIPESLGNLVHLEDLELNIYNSGGEKINLPHSLTTIAQLNVLSLQGDISQNSIDTILTSSKQLKSLYIIGNDLIKTLPTTLGKEMKLDKLILIGNPNLILNKNQLNFGIKLREKYGDKEIIFCPSLTSKCFTLKYGINFQYYSTI